MRRITVNAYQAALVFKRGKLIDVLTEGKYWLSMGKTVTTYDMTKPLHLGDQLTVYLQNDRLSQLVSVVNIADNELGFESKDGLFSRLLYPGKVAYWKSPVRYELKKVDLSIPRVPETLSRNILIRPEVANKIRLYTVESFEKGMLYIDGVYSRMLGPGVYRYWKTDPIASIVKIDTRTQSMEVSGQEILTKDKAGIRINFQVTYKVTDVELAVKESRDYVQQLYTEMQLAIREYVGSLTLDQLLSNKEKVGPYIVEGTKEAASTMGIRLKNGGIKDVILPGDMKDIMNQVLVAQKKAQANTIMRQEETASTRSLLNTAKLMENNVMLLKLKEMEYMEKIADKIGEISISGNSKIMDQLGALFVSKSS